MLQFKVLNPHETRDLVVEVPATAIFEQVKAKIKQAHGLPDTAYVRILCAGREMTGQDPVTKASSAVLHVITALEPPPPCPPSPDRSRMSSTFQQQAVLPPPPSQPPQTDWLDVIDPGTLLMWIFGLIISVLWLLLVFNSRMFDSTSVIILFIMTIAFLLPVALSFLPFPTFLTPHLQPWHLRAAPWQQGQQVPPPPNPGQGTIIDGEYIPPRPAARLRPHQS